jgi:hypothetical protein
MSFVLFLVKIFKMLYESWRAVLSGLHARCNHILSLRAGLHYRLVARIQFCSKSTDKTRHHKASLFCRDARAHWSHDSLLWYSGTIVQLHGKWRSLVSHKQVYVSQQLAYVGSDVILRLSLCAGVRAVIYFSRRPTDRTHNYRRLSAELEGSIVLSLTVCALLLTP